MPFERPRDIVEKRSEFTEREVGLTHLDHDGFIRIRDNGDIEIMAGESVGIVMNVRSGTITIMADKIKFLTKKDRGLQWNNLAFNLKATSFNQATLVPIDLNEPAGLYRGVHYFLED